MCAASTCDLANGATQTAIRTQPKHCVSSLFEQLQTIGHIAFAEQLGRCGGSMYLVAPHVVCSNVQRLLTSMQIHYSRSEVAYSYKSNYSSALVNAARGAGALSEVVSIDEYDYARHLNVQPDQIIYNGVGKRRCDLECVLAEPVTLIIDSLEELQLVAEISQSVAVHARLGLRVCPVLDFIKKPSRFGIDLSNEEQLAQVKSVLSKTDLQIAGLHLHHSGDRSVGSFVARLHYLRAIQLKLGLQKLQFVDLGGGIASGMPGELKDRLGYATDSLEQYGLHIAQAMKKTFGKEDVQLILEPGTGILADAGVFITTVLDTKRAGGNSFAVIDGTLFSIDPLRSSVSPLVHRIAMPDANDLQSVEAPVCIGGNSCMEIDVIHDSFPYPLKRGDVLMIAQKGAYAACMATPFIQGIPAMVGIDEHGSFRILRERTGNQLIGFLNDVAIDENMLLDTGGLA